MKATRLEIGPTHRQQRRPGWDTLDVQPGCTFTARWGFERLPVSDDSYDFVVASHVLEHIPWFHTRAALAEVRRILMPGGTFEVWVPDFATIAQAYADGSILDDWLPLNPERDPWKSLNGRLYWGARKGEVGQERHFHRACFDELSLTRLLSQAGLEDIQRAIQPPGKGHGWAEIGLICRKPTPTAVPNTSPLRGLVSRLTGFSKIVVTGPQRAGTTIAAKILAAELGYEFLREEAFRIHRLDLLCRIIQRRDRFVVQAPTMSGCCHYLTGVAIVFMRRKLNDILASEKRVEWNRSDFEKAKYFDRSDRSSAEVKYEAWDNFQKRLLGNRAFELEYEALSGHPLWVPEEERRNFGRRQTERSDGRSE